MRIGFGINQMVDVITGNSRDVLMSELQKKGYQKADVNDKLKELEGQLEIINQTNLKLVELIESLNYKNTDIHNELKLINQNINHSNNNLLDRLIATFKGKR